MTRRCLTITEDVTGAYRLDATGLRGRFASASYAAADPVDVLALVSVLMGLDDEEVLAARIRATHFAATMRVAIENPVMNPHAKARLPDDLPKPQIVQPWWFGDPAFKATGLYLRNLPPMQPTRRLDPPAPGTEAHKAWSMIHRASPGPDRWKLRSKTFPGMAEAWADQWGEHALKQEDAA